VDHGANLVVQNVRKELFDAALFPHDSGSSIVDVRSWVIEQVAQLPGQVEVPDGSTLVSVANVGADVHYGLEHERCHAVPDGFVLRLELLTRCCACVRREHVDGKGPLCEHDLGHSRHHEQARRERRGRRDLVKCGAAMREG
jgi:hypothetical protein